VAAHWGSQASGSVQAQTGVVLLDVAGSLTFDSPACGPGAGSQRCEKFDSDAIGTSPLSFSADGATFAITGWVHKHGEPSEAVGFYYTVTGGNVDVRVKSGRSYLEATLAEGSGLWLNPACQGDPGPGGGVTCNPKNTRAISYIAFCLQVPTPSTCPPMAQSLVASNVGSIPLRLEMWLADAGGGGYCDVFDLTIQLVINGGSTDPPLYQGPLCGLVDSALPLEAQLDPDEAVAYELTLSFNEPIPEIHGTTGDFTAQFLATQWNASVGWTDRVEVPLTISVADLPSENVSRGSPPSPGPDQIEDGDLETPADGESAEEEPPPDERPPEEPSDDTPAEEPPSEESPPAPEPAGLTGIVSLDEDGDGVRASAEPGLAGVIVRLLGDGVEIATTTTDATGSYSFFDLAVGVYMIEIEAPFNHVFTAPGQGGDPGLDSDVTTTHPVDGRYVGEIEVTLGSGMTTGVGDAGLVIDDAGPGG
ncbi:MAG: SdrD B-like domain-containing protein, partial [Acidimicrobiia bacterium]